MELPPEELNVPLCVYGRRLLDLGRDALEVVLGILFEVLRERFLRQWFTLDLVHFSG